MAARRKSRIATIRCSTDLKTLKHIAESSGLVAEPATEPDQFHILNAGRMIASEMRFALWENMSARLDEAVDKRAIPSWSPTR